MVGIDGIAKCRLTPDQKATTADVGAIANDVDLVHQLMNGLQQSGSSSGSTHHCGPPPVSSLLNHGPAARRNI